METMVRDTVLEDAASFGGVLADQYGVSSLDELMGILQLGPESPHLHALREQVISAERGKSPESAVIVDGKLFPPLAPWNEWSHDPAPSATADAAAAAEERGPSAWRRSAAFARKIAAAPLHAARASLNIVAPPSLTTFDTTEGRAYFYTPWNDSATGDRLMYHIPMADPSARIYNHSSKTYEFAETPEAMAYDAVKAVYDLDEALDKLDDDERDAIVKEAFGGLYGDAQPRHGFSPIAPSDLPMLLTRLSRELSIRVLGDREAFPSGAERMAANAVFQKVVEAGFADKLENFDDAETAAWKARRQERPRKIRALARSIMRQRVEEPIGHLPERETPSDDLWHEHAHKRGVPAEAPRRHMRSHTHAGARSPRRKSVALQKR